MTDARLTTTVTAALAKCATSIDAPARQRWAFTLSNGTQLGATAYVRDGWLLLEALLDAASVPARGGVWELLEWNATLGGGVRFAVDPRRRGTCARAELPLDGEVDLGRRIVEACAGLKAASDLLRGTVEAPIQRAGAERGCEGFRELCRESGWPVVERDPALFAVDLDVPGAFVQALAEPRADGSTSMAVPLLAEARPAEPAAICRQAVGLFLLRACGVVRMVRGAATRQDDTAPARFEVVFESAPCAAELAHAFAALSVASRIASREAGVLWGSEQVATAYVEQWEQNKEGQHGTGSSSEDGRAQGE
jgi:hypothetical protein